MTQLARLEAEAIHILREAAATARAPVMLYSAGKDSAVMLDLARKAFFPAPPPFPLLHVDTGWKFAAMYAERDRAAAESGMRLIIHRNPDAAARGINPFDHGALHTDLWKTEGLRQALAAGGTAGGFDLAFGGARRDEEKSRAKERIFSLRGAGHGWNPRAQRPELWDLYNVRTGPGESLRVFPLSNWTELDVWRYIAATGLRVAPLYYAAPRPTVLRDGMLLVIDDDRFRFQPGEAAIERQVRFRTLGCYPLTAAIESDATTADAIVAEMLATPTSERAGRLIDRDGGDTAMERKKREGYF